MGANIGTTVTAWLISILGFKVSMAKIALPIIGLSLPLLFTKEPKRKSIGEFMLGFALLFLGLEYLKNSVPDISQSPEIFAWIQHYSELGYIGYLLFVLIGTILTIVIQSSSATMALTLVMCGNGWIQFDLAAAMVLGENIGTTITANLAALVANTNARRAARAHLIFNVFWCCMGVGRLPFLSERNCLSGGTFRRRRPFSDLRCYPHCAVAVPFDFQYIEYIDNDMVCS
jgi:Na+/phosphate symporter